MINGQLSIFIIVALFFGTLASASAFIITYSEQKKNMSLSNRERVIRSLTTAFYSFVVLVGLTFITLFFLLGSF